MKITQITVTRKKNLGNYETADLSLSADLAEGDNIDKAAEDLAFYVDYKLNQSDRERKLAEIQEELQSGLYGKSSRNMAGKEITPEGIAGRQGWLDKYNEAVKRFNELEFIT